MKPLSECRLYTFIDFAYLNGREPEDIARQLCEGGSDLIQLRAKNIPTDVVRATALRIVPITQSANVGLVINDYPGIASEIGAELCHLGQEDFFDAGFRHRSDLLPPSSTLRLGLSTHSPDQARRALAAAPDYIAIGPVYATQTKPSARPVALDYVAWAAANLLIPWFAIGGITLHNLEAVLQAGARRICVVSAILSAPDIVQACQTLKMHLLSASL